MIVAQTDAPAAALAPLFDALTHLDDVPSAALPSVLERAAAAGVRHILTAGIDPHRPKAALPACAGLRIWRAVGLHPLAVADVAAQLAALEARLDASVHALGELGLDGRPGMPALPLQEEALRGQLDLARRHCLPVIVHGVQRAGRLLEMLLEKPLPRGGVLHGFSGPAEHVRPLVGAGFYFSFGTLLLHPKARRWRAALAAVPQDRLLFESDAPPAEPAVLAELVATAAAVRGVSPATLAQASTAAACRLYNVLGGGNIAALDREEFP